MFDFYQKRKLRNIAGSRITQGILLFLVFTVMWSAYDRFLIAQDMADKRAMVEADIIKLQERKNSLEAEVKYLSNERGIEAEMRRQFDIAKDGEQVVIILEDTSKEEKEDNATSSTKARPWYKFW